jgi:hypothetical protein
MGEHITSDIQVAKLGEYLVIRDGCSCSWMDPKEGANHLGMVRTGESNGGPYDYAITKITHADGRISIGKTTTPDFKTIYIEPRYSFQMEVPAPNVLVCESSKDMSTKPSMIFGNKACGLWSRYKPNGNANFPASHGLKVGIDRNGNDAYVGRGINTLYQWFGRLQIVGESGVYTSGTNNETIGILPEYLVVPNGCTCEFLPFDTAVTKIGLIRILDNTGLFRGVGLKSLNNGRIAITTVYIDYKMQYYVGDDGTAVFDRAETMLVCETA